MLAIKKRLAAMSDGTAAMQLQKLFEGLYNSQCLTAANWVATATAPALGNAIAVMCAGMIVMKATGFAAAALNGPTVALSGATWQAWIFTTDQAGNMVTYAGTPATTAAGITLPYISDYNGVSGLPQTVIGALVINNGSGAAFIPGTTLLNVAGLNPVTINTVGPFFPFQFM
jgi:hypothetical protein